MDLRVNRDGELPLGTQLTWKLRSAIASGELPAGTRLPSVREAAAAAGVNVNTVRAVYGRLEREGLVSSEQGRGTFVSGSEDDAPAAASRATPGAGDRADGASRAHEEAQARRALREQIAALEAELARLPPPPSEAQPTRNRAPAGGALLSATELTAVRDGLQERLDELNAARAEVLRRLDELPATERTEAAGPRRPSTSTPSLAGARVRWVGA